MKIFFPGILSYFVSILAKSLIISFQYNIKAFISVIVTLYYTRTAIHRPRNSSTYYNRHNDAGCYVFADSVRNVVGTRWQAHTYLS
jgi:hypothetical protein